MHDRHASAERRRDRALVEEAVRQDSGALLFASNRFSSGVPRQRLARGALGWYRYGHMAGYCYFLNENH